MEKISKREKKLIFKIIKQHKFKDIVDINTQILEKAKTEASRFSGKCISQIVVSENQELAYQCKMKHIFKRNFVDGHISQWCVICESWLNECKRIAKMKQGKINFRFVGEWNFWKKSEFYLSERS